MDSFLSFMQDPLFNNPFLLILKFLHVVLPVLNPCPSNNSNILSCFLYQETPSVPQSLFSQDFGTRPRVMFPHPPAQLMEDLSV